MTTRLPTYFLSHGGGPWPFMKHELGGRFDRLEASLQAIRRELHDQPRALLVVSGHWETEVFAVSSSARPGMVYDYYGFPDYTYGVTYPAPGAPDLAQRVLGLIGGGGFDCAADPDRGLDHGTFSLMMPIYPKADMPVVQLSVRRDYDPAAHIAVGRLLAPLRDEGVLIVGSGSSFHNLRMRDERAREPSRQFDAWLSATLEACTPAERVRRLEDWTQAPAARIAHPEEDHLLPLMAAVGAAGEDEASRIFHQDDFLGAWAVSAWRFGPAPAAEPFRAAEDRTPSPVAAG